MVQENFPSARFEPQQIVCGYIPDMYSWRYKIALEVDGRIHQRMGQAIHDEQKDRVFAEKGIRVLRFGEGQVLRWPDEVIAQISDALYRRRGEL